MKKGALVILLLMHCCLCAKGQSVHFPDGLGNRLDIGDLDVGGTAITVEALVTPQPAGEQAMDIVCKHYLTNDVNYFLRTTAFTVRAGNRTISVPNPVKLCANTAYHVAGTYDGQSLKYYVNGVMVASVPCSGPLNLNDNIAAIGNMWNKGGNYNEQYSGYVDEVRIWKTARTQQEIAGNMYNLSNPASQPGLLAYYKFDGNFQNIQGNAAWNGKPNKAQVRLTINPYFKGAVSNTFCGGESFFKNAKTVASANAEPILPKPPEQVSTSVVAPKPVSPTLPDKAKPNQPAAPLKEALPPATKTAAAPRPVPPKGGLQIEVWDFDCMDYDSVSITFNGKTVGKDAMLLRLYKRNGSPEYTFNLDCTPGDNVLEILAINEGVNPFNTIGIQVIDGDSRKKYYYRLKPKEKAALHFVKE